MASARPRPTSLTISTPPNLSWRAARPPTPRRATFPLPGTTSTSLNFASQATPTPPVPPLSYWLPDTPSPLLTLVSPKHPHSPISPLSPHSPLNPFLIPPRDLSALFPRASPLLPASPLSVFDHAVSPTFLLSRSPTPTPTFLLPASPSALSPRFLFPRTPPRVPELVAHRKMSAVEAVMARKGSVASALTAGQERLRWRSEFFQWLAVRRWEGMQERDEKRGLWKRVFRRWTGVIEKANVEKVVRREGLVVLKGAAMCG